MEHPHHPLPPLPPSQHAVPVELEDLVLCSCCHQPFNNADALPKILACRHFFCTKCVCTIMYKNGELYCIHCWNRTELPASMQPDALPTHTAIVFLTRNMDILSILSRTNCGGGSSASEELPQQHQRRHASPPTTLPPIGTPPSTTNYHHQQLQRGPSSVGSTAASSTTTNGAAAATAAVGASQSPPSPAPTANGCGENCHTHAMPKSLWCVPCNALICRGCAAGSAEHAGHAHKPYAEARDAVKAALHAEVVAMQKTVYSVQNLVMRQREFLLRICGLCTALKTQLERDLCLHGATLHVAEARASCARAQISLASMEQHSPVEACRLFGVVLAERQRLQARCREMWLQCKMDELVAGAGTLLDFHSIRQYLTGLNSNEFIGGGVVDAAAAAAASDSSARGGSMLCLGNYCVSQLYAKHARAAMMPMTMTMMMHAPNDGRRSQMELNNNAVYSTTTTTADLLHAIDMFKGPNDCGMSDTACHSNGLGGGGRMSSASFMSSGSSDLNGSPGGGVVLPLSVHHNHQPSATHSGSSVQLAADGGQMQSSLLYQPSAHVFPIYFLNLDINGVACGRVLVEVRSDIAPRMAKNFGALATGDGGLSYKGCQVFQCWENESIITGDFELNNGRGGRSVYEERFFMPDDTKLLAARGSVGMRRSQKRHDNMGLVGSQFRIILREMRGFTGIFAYVIEGLELVEKISHTGDSAGKPHSSVSVTNCGIVP